MIRLENITKKYGDVTVFENYSLTVADGEKFVISGKSGCGKTTLLNIISGITKCDGTVETDGRFAYMFQEPRLLPWMSVRKNIISVLTKQNLHLADKYITLVGIEEFADKAPSNLSGGMAQRAAFARMLAYAEDTKAKLLLLDEPFSALDGETAERMMNVLKDFSMDRTVLLVTHEQNIAQDFGATVIIL